MRHRSKTAKLKRNASHRKALLSNLACSLIEHGRIKTTLGKAKALRPVAEKLVTLAKRDDLHSRRLAIAFLHQKDTVKKLFSEVAPAVEGPPGRLLPDHQARRPHERLRPDGHHRVGRSRGRLR